MKTVNIGVDVGNHDTKTSNTSTPSGFNEFSKIPFGTDEYIKFKDIYYVPNITRFPYVKDKTINENCFILTLFGIAKEIVASLNKSQKLSREEIQNQIDKIRYVNIGVGLPPTHCATLSGKMKNYYHSRFDDGITFEYNGYVFQLKLNICEVFPQDFSAVITYNPKNEDSILKKFKRYYAIDIGGYTVDVVPIVNGNPDVSKCASKELGVLKMYDSIIPRVEMETGTTLSAADIEAVLKKENTILDEKEIELIHECAEDWLENIINQLKQSGLEFATTPVVFMGGGAQLFKKYIRNNKLIKKYEFIPGARSNADGFKKLITLKSSTK